MDGNKTTWNTAGPVAESRPMRRDLIQEELLERGGKKDKRTHTRRTKTAHRHVYYNTKERGRKKKKELE